MKRRRTAQPALAGSNKRAHALIECMLKEMQRGLRDPTRLETPEWERLFGTKQSMIVNVQKLVQALATLPVEAVAASAKPIVLEDEGLTAEERALLSAWLAETSE